MGVAVETAVETAGALLSSLVSHGYLRPRPTALCIPLLLGANRTLGCCLEHDELHRCDPLLEA